MRRTSSFFESSLHSSEQDTFYNCIPETNTSAFSPDDMITTSSLDPIIGAPINLPERSPYHPIIHEPFEMDTFVSSSSANTLRLSPTATSFTPSHSPDQFGLHSRTVQPKNSGILPEFEHFTLSSDSDAFNYPGPISTCGLRRSPSDNSSLLHRDRLYNRSNSIFDTSPDRLAGEGIRPRAFTVEAIPTTLSYLTLAALFDRREFTTLKGPVLTEFSEKGKIFVGFTDMRDAQNAFSRVKIVHPEWKIKWITTREFSQKLDPASKFTSDYESRVLVSVQHSTPKTGVDGFALLNSLKTLLSTFGDIKSFLCLSCTRNMDLNLFAEFFDAHAAGNVVSTLNGTTIDNYALNIKLCEPDAENACDHTSISHLNRTESVPITARTNQSRFPQAISSSEMQCVELSPTGRSTIPRSAQQEIANWLLMSQGSTTGRMHDSSRYGDYRSMNQNYVDIDRIREGLDVRTTIMLRNIPNKIDQSMLKEIVDETSHGKYDFMYLRIDFANNCNVGYAFINFEDPIDIIDFANARAGHTWNCFNSDKVAEISYATIQGKDCLIQKFRNSSVMLEDPSFRPKIFHTGTGPLASTEDRFPGPDNPSKMRRSVENAEHVGLFAPRVGQQYRDEQRRRRSRFDRGTIATERETAFYRPFSHLYGAVSSPGDSPRGTSPWWGDSLGYQDLIN